MTPKHLRKPKVTESSLCDVKENGIRCQNVATKILKEVYRLCDSHYKEITENQTKSNNVIEESVD